MSYTREQLNEAIRAKNDQAKKLCKLHPVLAALAVAAFLGGRIGVGAGLGALVGLVLSSVSLSSLIAGGIIGFAAPLIGFVIHACFSFKENALCKRVEENISEEHQQILREYNNSTECKVKGCVNGIANIAVSFGIGVGLVALGFTSPAAIGAVTLVAALAVSYSFGFMIDAAIECFFPDGSSKQPDSLVSDMKVDGADKNHSPEQPLHC